MAIDGLVSGLDTTSIIESLMAVERLPQQMLAQRRSAAQAALDAYASVKAKVTAVATAATGLQKATDWAARKATSTNGDIATVSATVGASTGSLEFTVDKLATTHSLAGVNTLAATTTAAADGASITITTSEGPQVVNVGGGSLAEVVAAVNDAKVGVTAAAVNTGSGYKLQFTASKSGEAAEFTVAGLAAAVGGTSIVSQGSDAELTVGTGPGKYLLTSASNTFTDLLPGVTVNAKSVSASPVRIDVTADADALAKKVSAFVDAINGAIAEVKTRTAYDPKTQTAASLNGDPAVRRLTQALSRAVSEAVGSSSLGSASAAGVSSDKFGNITFDQTKFLAAYAADPAAVEKLFVQSATTTGSVEFVSAGWRAGTGSHDVIVTTAAAQAVSVGLVGAWPVTTPTTIRLKVGSTEVLYAIQPTDTAEDARAGLQAAVDASDLDLTVTEEGGGLAVRSEGVGMAAMFEVAWDGVTFDLHQGVDIAGTIGGKAATGAGNVLTVPFTEAGLGGMSVKVSGSALGNVGGVGYEPGVAQRVLSAANTATDTVDGYLVAAETARKSRHTDLGKSIDAYEQRLTLREARLKKQFSALEVALGGLQNQSSWLAGQLASLPTGSSS